MTSPLLPESVAQMVADLTTKAAMINMGENIATGIRTVLACICQIGAKP